MERDAYIWRLVYGSDSIFTVMTVDKAFLV